MNIIDAINNLVQNPVIEIVSSYTGNNRANNAGAALEEYIKDLFANTFNMSDDQRKKELKKVFSYIGNTNNPPDAMLKDGDAIEVKKIESAGAKIALNSSYPKQKLKSDSTMISNECQTAETWTEKDLIYAVGVVKEKKLKRLAMVYGVDYCANDKYYTKLRDKIKKCIHEIQGIKFDETNEFAHVSNEIDPFDVTYLRVRGMWGISNPWKVFEYVLTKNPKDEENEEKGENKQKGKKGKKTEKKFEFMCIINDEKWKTFDNTDLLVALKKEGKKGFDLKDISIKNPDDAKTMVPAKLITFCID